jgi:hypothetical protein
MNVSRDFWLTASRQVRRIVVVRLQLSIESTDSAWFGKFGP